MKFLHCWRVIRISNELLIETTHRWLQEGTSRPLHPSAPSELPSRSTRQQHIIKDGKYLFAHNSQYLELLNPQASPKSACDLGALPAAGININYCWQKMYLGKGGKKSARHSFSLQPWPRSNLITLKVVNGCLKSKWESGRWRRHDVQPQTTDEKIETKQKSRCG